MKPIFRLDPAREEGLPLSELLVVFAIIAMLPTPAQAAILDLSLRGTWSPTNSGMIESVAVKNGHAYCALRHDGLAVIDIRNPLEPRRVGGYDGFAKEVVTLGHHAYVTEQAANLHVFDIADPASLREVANLDLTCSALDRLKGFENHICVNLFTDKPGLCGETGLAIVDVSDPISPRRISLLPADGRAVVTAQRLYLAGRFWNDLEPGYALHIFDLSNPASLRWLGSFRPDDPATVVSDVAVVGSFAFVGGWVSGSVKLFVVDIHDPARPKQVGATEFSGGEMGGEIRVEVAGSLAYVTSNSLKGPPRVEVFDITHPSLPKHVGSDLSTSYPYSIAVFDRFVCLARAILLESGSLQFRLEVIETLWRPSPPYSALYVFGDSWNATAGGPYWQGRWSNGPMWPEVLSTNLGFMFVRTNNFAAGYATLADVANTQVPRLRSIPEPDHSLFVVWAGGNDVVAAGAHTTSTLKSDTIWTNLIRQMVKSATNAVKTLYTKGARSIVVVDLDDLNHITDVNLNTQDAALLRSRIADYNAALQVAMDQVDQVYPDLRLFQMSFHDRWDSLVQQYAGYGFVRTDLGALNDRTLTDKSYAGPGRDYLFWDGAHPTSRTHTIWAGWFQDIAANQRPERLELDHESNDLTVHLNKLRVGRDYILQTSENLTDWLDALKFPSAVGTNLWHGSAAAKSSGFFRLKWQN